MVKIINVQEEEKRIKEENMKKNQLNKLLEIVERELPAGCEIRPIDKDGNSIFVYRSSLRPNFSRVHFFSEGDYTRVSVDDKKLENFAIKIAEEYEKLIGKEIEVKLDYR